jgi:hypothetical protein
VGQQLHQFRKIGRLTGDRTSALAFKASQIEISSVGKL